MSMDTTLTSQTNLMPRLLRKRLEVKRGSSPQRDCFSDTASVSSQRSNSPRSIDARILPVSIVCRHVKHTSANVLYCGDQGRTMIDLCAKIFKPILSKKIGKVADSSCTKKETSTVLKKYLSGNSMKNQLFLKPWTNPRARRGSRSTLGHDSTETPTCRPGISDSLRPDKRAYVENFINDKMIPITKKQKLDLSSSHNAHVHHNASESECDMPYGESCPVNLKAKLRYAEEQLEAHAGGVSDIEELKCTEMSKGISTEKDFNIDKNADQSQSQSTDVTNALPSTPLDCVVGSNAGSPSVEEHVEHQTETKTLVSVSSQQLESTNIGQAESNDAMVNHDVDPDQVCEEETDVNSNNNNLESNETDDLGNDSIIMNSDGEPEPVTGHTFTSGVESIDLADGVDDQPSQVNAAENPTGTKIPQIVESVTEEQFNYSVSANKVTSDSLHEQSQKDLINSEEFGCIEKDPNSVDCTIKDTNQLLMEPIVSEVPSGEKDLEQLTPECGNGEDSQIHENLDMSSNTLFHKTDNTKSLEMKVVGTCSDTNSTDLAGKDEMAVNESRLSKKDPKFETGLADFDVDQTSVCLESGTVEDETAVSSDNAKALRLVTEVCACDTTTGSNEDDSSASKSNVEFNDQSVITDIVTPPLTTVREFKKKNVTLSQKTRNKKQNRKMPKSPKNIQRKKTVHRRKPYLDYFAKSRRSLRKPIRKNIRLPKSQRQSPIEGASRAVDTSLDAAVESSSANQLNNETDQPNVDKSYLKDVSMNNPIPVSDPVPVYNSANVICNDSYFGHIEIVDDEEDDEEPWPFISSPPSSTDLEAMNTESIKVNASPIPGDGLLNSKFANNEPTTLKSDHGNVSKEIRSTTPIGEQAGNLETKSPPSIPSTEKGPVRTSSLMENKPLNFTTPLTIKPASKALREALAGKSNRAKKSYKTKSLTDQLNISPRIVESESYQHAKMQSGTPESKLKDSITDSMWKDMFNSDIVPLDFDDRVPSMKATDKEQQKLPVVYEKSCARMMRSDVKSTSSQPMTDYLNTPCGDSYPVTQTSRIEPLTAANMKLCSCKSEGSQSPSKKKPRIMFCQAIDTVNNRTLNCVNKVTDKTEMRASARLPSMVLCKHHRKKLSQHASCPVCGLFCAGGSFVDCTSGKGHLHHVSCQVKAEDGTYLCPHCGEKSSQVSISKTSKRKSELQKFKQPSKKESTEGIARMCIRLVTKPTNHTTDDMASYESKLFEVSRSKLLDGAEKTKLITIMSGIEHLLPAMQEKLSSPVSSTSLYDLSSYILKNDLSQLALGICDVIRSCKESEWKYPLDKQFTEQGGKTLLHLAVQSNSLATVHCLVMAGAALNTSDLKGTSPLMLAAEGNQLDILKYLIGAGAMTEWRDIDGKTSLHMAAIAGNKAICEYLLNNQHVSVDSADEGGWTPLVWAIENGHTHVVKALLSADADIHLRDNEGNASIHWGAYSGHTEIIKLLISRGAEIEAVNELGDRPLHIAVRRARTDAVILLLSHGADTSAINNQYQTPAECCHGACSENMKSFLAVNDVLRSCKLGGIITRSSKLLHQDIARGKENVPIPVTNDVDEVNYPTDFIYVTESVFTSPVPVNSTISSLNRCNCAGDCTRASCSCARASITCWYESGVLSENFDFTNPPRLFECNKACGCWNTCSNRVVQRGITSQLELFKTAHRGWGVRTRHEIAQGTFVCEYVGELITDSQADEREDDSYLFDLDYKDGDTYCMDAKHYGNISRFINHRCEPNLTPVSVFIDHQDLRFPRICLFANTKIEPGTELGFDYGEKFWLVKYKHFLCDCGCRTCKYSKSTIEETLAQHLAATTSSPLSSKSTASTSSRTCEKVVKGRRNS